MLVPRRDFAWPAVVLRDEPCQSSWNISAALSNETREAKRVRRGQLHP